MAFHVSAEMVPITWPTLLLGEENLDVFAVFGFHADGNALSNCSLRSYFRTVVMASTERHPSVQKAK